MPVEYPPSIIAEKNKLATKSAFLNLLHITLPDSSEFFVTDNNEDIEYPPGGQVYTAIPFQIEFQESIKGELQSINLKVSNVTRYPEGYVDASEGGVGGTIILVVVNSDYLNEDYVEAEIEFTIIGCSVDTQWVTFILGAPNDYRGPYPGYKYLPDNCNWKFATAECKFTSGYSGYTTCGRTFADCEIRTNTSNFGGYKGLAGGGLRVV